jgi:hypothetical protein
MKTILIACCWLSSIASPDIAQVRALFLDAYVNESSARKLAEVLNDCSKQDPVFTGYRGMSQVMMCNYVHNPFSKLSFFLNGRNLIEQALAQDPGNVELRFLRFTVQSNVPSILNYSNKLTEDKSILLGYIMNGGNSGGKTAELRSMITAYFMQTSCCSEEEKQLIRNGS